MSVNSRYICSIVNFNLSNVQNFRQIRSLPIPRIQLNNVTSQKATLLPFFKPLIIPSYGGSRTVKKIHNRRVRGRVNHGKCDLAYVATWLNKRGPISATSKNNWLDRPVTICSAVTDQSDWLKPRWVEDGKDKAVPHVLILLLVLLFGKNYITDWCMTSCMTRCMIGVWLSTVYAN